jgi:DNA polymerase III gamma/tau subunit
MPDQIITRHRPNKFRDVFGNKDAINALGRQIAQPDDRRSRAYLLSGPSGVGKTTIARLIALHVGAEILEIDAGANNGVDAMRELTELARHRAFSGDGRRMIILNEVQAMTRNSWNALLTILEEPPPHLYFALTTTEKNKIPIAAVTRCTEVDLVALTRSEMADYIDFILAEENWDIDDDIVQLIVDYALGSPRQCLTILEKIYDVKSVDEARRIINIHKESDDAVIELCRYLLRTSEPDWVEVRDKLRLIEDDAFQRAQLNACRYIMGAMTSIPKERQSAERESRNARNAWVLLDSFMQPSQTYDVGIIMWA